jgi:hypothetical protein
MTGRKRTIPTRIPAELDEQIRQIQQELAAQGYALDKTDVYRILGVFVKYQRPIVIMPVKKKHNGKRNGDVELVLPLI